MPLSFKGRLIQYAGRLHRQHNAKGEPLIFDYLEDNHAITQAMFRRRLVFDIDTDQSKPTSSSPGSGA